MKKMMVVNNMIFSAPALYGQYLCFFKKNNFLDFNTLIGERYSDFYCLSLQIRFLDNCITEKELNKLVIDYDSSFNVINYHRHDFKIFKHIKTFNDFFNFKYDLWDEFFFMRGKKVIAHCIAHEGYYCIHESLSSLFTNEKLYKEKYDTIDFKVKSVKFVCNE